MQKEFDPKIHPQSKSDYNHSVSHLNTHKDNLIIKGRQVYDQLKVKHVDCEGCSRIKP